MWELIYEGIGTSSILENKNSYFFFAIDIKIEKIYFANMNSLSYHFR